MKKTLAGLLAALLVLSMGTTVFAASSPGSKDVELAAKAENAAQAATVSSDTASLTKSILSAAIYQQATEEAATLGNSAEVLAAFELKVGSGTFPITVKIEVSGISAGDSVKILHYTGTDWEKITPDEVGDGYVKATFYSLSPIAVVRTAAAGSGSPSGSTNTANNSQSSTSLNNGSSTSSTGSSSSGGNTQTNNNNQTVNVYTTGTGASTSTTSPKTGASLPALPIIAIFTIMGIAVFGKKARSL